MSIKIYSKGYTFVWVLKSGERDYKAPSPSQELLAVDELEEEGLSFFLRLL